MKKSIKMQSNLSCSQIVKSALSDRTEKKLNMLRRNSAAENQ